MWCLCKRCTNRLCAVWYVWTMAAQSMWMSDPWAAAWATSAVTLLRLQFVLADARGRFQRSSRLNPHATGYICLNICNGLIFLPQHRYSAGLLHRYSGEETLLPVHVTGDGNCFFNALSVVLYGSENLAAEICLWCCIYYALHLETLSDKKLFEVAVPSLPEDLQAVSKGGWSSARAFIAAANVLEVNIESVYLPVNSISDPVACALLTTFCPESGQSWRNITIMCTFHDVVEKNDTVQNVLRTSQCCHFPTCRNWRLQSTVLNVMWYVTKRQWNVFNTLCRLPWTE